MVCQLCRCIRFWVSTDFAMCFSFAKYRARRLLIFVIHIFWNYYSTIRFFTVFDCSFFVSLKINPTNRNPADTTPTRSLLFSTLSINMARRFTLFGNWKCNGSSSTISDLATAFNKTAAELPADERLVVGVCPTAYHFPATRAAMDARVKVGAQNVYHKSGAFTGEWTPAMLEEIEGLTHVIIGHSERRQYFNDNEIVPAKVRATLEQSSLDILLCIGETLEQYEAKESVAVCERQLADVLANLGKEMWAEHVQRIVIAYEPIFAIGTGVAATPDHAQMVHAAVRAWLRENVGEETAEDTCIQYGGSVSMGNCEALFSCPDVDGGLVGGASLKPDFLEIAKVLAAKKL